jgi:hypothetical protein
MRNMTLLTGFLLLWPTLTGWSQEPGPRPAVELILAPGEASAVPLKKGAAYANGGVVSVVQPNPTTIVVTMTGLTAANADGCWKSMANYSFDLTQDFELVFNSKGVKSATLTLEGRVIGLLRTKYSHHEGGWHKDKQYATAETMPAAATVSCGPAELVTLALPARVAAGCDDLSVYNHEGPLSVSVKPSKFTLHETWGFGTTHAAFHSRGASAEFAPQPNYVPESNPLIAFQPFNGLATRDFGFQMTLKVVPEF